MFQLVKVVSRPPFPEVLELLICLPPGHSTHFDIRIINGRHLGKWFANQEVSRGEIGCVWIIRRRTEGSGIEASLDFN